MKTNPYRGEIGQKNRNAIIAHFAQKPDDWICIAELARITDCSANCARTHCYNLYTTGYLEETKIMIVNHDIQHFRKCR